MRNKTEWIDVDLSMNKEELPYPLNIQSGGYFWVLVDGGIHGKQVFPSYWNGKKFSRVNNERIIKFFKMIMPKPPNE